MNPRFVALVLVILSALTAAPLHAAGAPFQRPPTQTTGDRTGDQVAADEVAARIAAIKETSGPLRHSFNFDTGEWDNESSEDVVRSYGAGVYQLRIETPNTIGWSSGPVRAGDFYVEVDTYHVSGPLDNEFGLLFRNDGSNYYVYSISSDGYFRIQKWLDGEWQSVVDWTEAPAIADGEGSHNTLGLLAEGPQLSVLVNGEVLATAADDTIQGDGLALAAASFDEAGVEIAFEDFTYWPTTEAADNPVTDTTQAGDETAGDETAGDETAGDETASADTTVEPPAAPDPALLQTLVEPIRDNDPDYSDDFGSEDDRWPTVEYEQGSIAFARRGLNFRITAPNYALWTTGQEIAGLNPADMLVESEVVRRRGANNDTYGLLVRYVDNDNFYYFGISGAGTFSFWRVVAGEWRALVEWTASTAILTADEDVNRLGVLAQGDRFLLLVNDVPVADVHDATFAAGGAGFYAGTYEQNDLDVTFDNMDVWVLSQGEVSLPIDEEALAAAQARADEVRASEAAYSTRFTRDDGAWSTGSDDSATIDIQRGRLRIDVAATQWFAWSQRSEEAADLLLEVDAIFADNATPGEVGIVFRKQDDGNFYLVAIDNAGRASIWKKEANQWQALAPWAKSDAIRTEAGAENRIGVLAEGTSLSALVNGQVVAAVEDASFATGTLALAVGSFASPNVAATFDNVSMWQIGE